MLRVQKICSHGLSTIWNFDSSTSKAFLRRPEGTLWILRTIHLLKTSLKRLHPSRIFRSSGCIKWVLHFYPLKHPFIDLKKSRFLRLPEDRFWPFSYLKNHLSIVQLAFFDAQDAQNEYAWPFDLLKHRLIDFNKVVFKTSRRPIMNSQCHCLLKTSLKQLRPSRSFRRSGYRKCVRMAFPQLETSLHRLHQSRFIWRSEGRLFLLRATRLLKTSLPRLRPNPFFKCPECWKWVQMAFRHYETLLHRPHKSHFNIFRRQIISFLGLSST
jgi:hypothetical protein